MANESGSQNQNGPSNTNRVLIGIAVVLIAVAIYFAFQGGDDEGDNDDQGNEQTQSPTPAPTPNPAPTPTPTATPGDGDEVRGNVAATGTLRASDNAARGNYVLESNRGKIYISTSRDFSSQVGKQVTLQADGTLDNFTFLGFADGTVLGNDADAGDVGGAADEAGDVSFKGVLRVSDDLPRANYMVVSGDSNVYLKSVRDYSAWVGTEVTLKAVGTLNSFSQATLSK
jgi:hypothetical protein